MKTTATTFLFISISIVGSAQDSVMNITTKPARVFYDNKKFLSARSVIIPTIMIGYGFTSLGSKPLQHINKEIREEITEYKTPFKTCADDYMKYAPAAAVFALDAFGVKSKHSFVDRAILYFVSTTLTNSLVTKLKHSTHLLRPDGSTYNSFPSGHTATAFTGAELLHQEYGFHSPWYSVAGYTIATATGTLRIMNNRHWISDVITGAGLGILSAKFSYWLYYKIKPGRKRQKPLY